MKQLERKQERKQDPMTAQYKRACNRLLPGEQAVNEVIQMKSFRETKRRPMHKKAAALAAACVGIFACSIVGTAAARHFQVQFFVDGKVVQIGAAMEQKEDSYVVHLDGKEQGQREMTLAEQLGIFAVYHADKDTVGLVLGEEERDITKELQADDSYQTTWEQGGNIYLVQVTGEKTAPEVTVTEQ